MIHIMVGRTSHPNIHVVNVILKQVFNLPLGFTHQLNINRVNNALSNTKRLTDCKIHEYFVREAVRKKLCILRHYPKRWVGTCFKTYFTTEKIWKLYFFNAWLHGIKSSKRDCASNVIGFYAEFVSLETKLNITHVLIFGGWVGRSKQTKMS